MTNSCNAYNTFVKTSQTIFDSFPNEQGWSQGGFKPNRQIQNPEAGYCVVLRYDEKVTGAIAQFMAKVHTVLPHLLVYNKQDLHTTIGTFGKTDMNAFVPDAAKIRHLAESVEKGISGCSQNIYIEFGKWLYNDETILVSGYPNQALWDLCQTLGNAFHHNGLTLQMGRILHITTARFTGRVSYQAFEKFSSLMKSAPALEAVKPAGIDLAAWYCDGLSFKLVPHKNFVL